MSKKPLKNDGRQLSILEHIKPKEPPKPGSMNISARVRMLISDAIHNSGKRIEIICAEIYSLTGLEISVSTLRKWSAPSTDLTSDTRDENGNKRWSIPAEVLPAFCQVTGADDLLFLLNETCHYKALKGKEVVHARMGLLKEEKLKIEKELKELERELLKTNGGVE